jgi:hypothetical protein
LQLNTLSLVREIRWTDKAEDHIAAHNVTPDEVEQIVYTRPRLVLRERSTCSVPPMRADIYWSSSPSRSTGEDTWSPRGT